MGVVQRGARTGCRCQGGRLAGITVGLVDTTLEDPSMAVTQVALDNEGGGAAAFEAIKEADPDGGTVLVVGHEPGISTNEARIKGFLDALGEDPAFTALPTQYAQNDPAEGAASSLRRCRPPRT